MTELSYRNLRAADFEDIHTLCSHWETVRQLGSWPWPPEPDFTQSRCNAYEGDGFVWAICDKDRLIGTIGVAGSLGYMLNPEFAGRGIMTLAVNEALTHAFEVDMRKQVCACTWFDNPASMRVLTKAGFEKTGETTDHAKARNAPTLSFTYSLSSDRWQTLRRHAQ